MKNVRTSKAAGTVHTVGAVSAATEVPPERAQFRALLVGNPNYFGTLPKSPFKPVIKLQGNTTYEELKLRRVPPAGQPPRRGGVRQPAVRVRRRRVLVRVHRNTSGSTSRSTTARRWVDQGVPASPPTTCRPRRPADAGSNTPSAWAARRPKSGAPSRTSCWSGRFSRGTTCRQPTRPTTCRCGATSTTPTSRSIRLVHQVARSLQDRPGQAAAGPRRVARSRADRAGEPEEGAQRRGAPASLRQAERRAAPLRAGGVEEVDQHAGADRGRDASVLPDRAGQAWVRSVRHDREAAAAGRRQRRLRGARLRRIAAVRLERRTGRHHPGQEGERLLRRAVHRRQPRGT